MMHFDLAVVIPAMNAERSIGSAVTSAFESGASAVTVVDDGSSDGTAVVAAAAGAQVLSQPNSGPTVARIRGLQQTSATLVCFLDADDVLCRDGIRDACQMLVKDEDAVAVVGRYRYAVDGNVRSVAAIGYKGLSIPDLLSQGHGPAPPSAVVYRTAAVKVAAATDTAHWTGAQYADDYELLLRTAGVGAVRGTDAVTCVYAFGSGRSFYGRSRELEDRRLVQQHYARVYEVPISGWSVRRERATVLLSRARLESLRRHHLRSVAYAGGAIVIDPALVIRAVRRRTMSRPRHKGM
jgi:glycosyltransferase involved in cell wall biosynthesis